MSLLKTLGIKLGLRKDTETDELDEVLVVSIQAAWKQFHHTAWYRRLPSKTRIIILVLYWRLVRFVRSFA